MATDPREDRVIPSAANNWGAKTKDVTVNGVTYKGAIDVGSGKPPAATKVGMVSPSSGLTITGTERNMAKEREAMNIGYTKEYIASRGGINSQGYFNDTPISGQLTAEEQRRVTLPNGTVNTGAMAEILQRKQIAELISQGVSEEEAYRRVTSQYGDFGISYTPSGTGGTDMGGMGGGTFGTGTGTGTGMGTSGTPTAPFTAPGTLLAKDVFKNTLATLLGATEAAKPWVDALYDVVSKTYKSGMDIGNAINISLQEARNNPALQSFTDRFKGWYSIQDLRQAGKPIQVPTLAEFVASQAALGDIFRRANLEDLATETFTGDILGTGKSVSTITSAIANAFNRIDQAPQAIKDTLSRYYPTVDRTTLARTLLLGTKGVEQLVDELGKYEVLAAAEQQGIAATGAKPITGGVTEERAGEFARMGGTYASLMPKFAAVREVTPVVSKLAGISRRGDIGQVGVEQALISGLAQPLEDIRLLGEEEISRFSGKAGRAEVGLASQRRANRAY
jgi:hypothetical protein